MMEIGLKISITEKERFTQKMVTCMPVSGDTITVMVKVCTRGQVAMNIEVIGIVVCLMEWVQ